MPNGDRPAWMPAEGGMPPPRKRGVYWLDLINEKKRKLQAAWQRNIPKPTLAERATAMARPPVPFQLPAGEDVQQAGSGVTGALRRAMGVTPESMAMTKRVDKETRAKWGELGERLWTGDLPPSLTYKPTAEITPYTEAILTKIQQAG